MELLGRCALVTGAGHRVGRAIAVALGARGMRVAVHYHAAADGARQTLRQIEEAGGEGSIMSADLTRPESAAELVLCATSTFGGLDVLINSAAVMARTPFGAITADQWDGIMALNLRAPFLLAQAAAPYLRMTRGAIVNVADLAAFETWPAYLPHGISKSGLVHMTRSLARILAPEVRVAGVAPGTVMLPDDWNAEAEEHLRKTTPLGRMGNPDDVTKAVIFILESDYLTGETIIVDGGRHVRR